MAEKYQANRNNDEQAMINNEAPQKTQDEINAENNANTIRNAADVAIATKNPYAVAAGTAVKVLDKVSGGKSTEYLGKKMNDINKVAPGGKNIQKLSNDLSESGVGDKIGKAASMKNASSGNASQSGSASGTASNVANNVSKTSNSTDSISKTTNTSNSNVNSNKTNDISNSNSDTALDSTEQGKSDKSFFENAFSNDGGIDLFKIVKKKYLIIFGGGIFFFIIIMFAIVAGKDMGNMDLTNESDSMSGYSPENMGVGNSTIVTDIKEESINGGNSTILTNGSTINSMLGESAVINLSHTISDSAKWAGYGTGAAPVAAAKTLIQNLLNNDIIIPFFSGGGTDKITTGVNGEWGAYEYVSESGRPDSFSNQPLGLDSVGFVSWAMYNGGCTEFVPIEISEFKLLGPNINFEESKPGDIAVSDSHISLILENKGTSLLCAEAKDTSYGVVFTEYSIDDLQNYIIVDMANYYQLNCS